MDDIVAVEVELADGGGRRYFVTWGRIQHAVDGEPVARLVLRYSRTVALGGTPVRARLCPTLRVAADSAEAPYFYECLMIFASRLGSVDRHDDSWTAERAAAMAAGREIGYCGDPRALVGVAYPWVAFDEPLGRR